MSSIQLHCCAWMLLLLPGISTANAADVTTTWDGSTGNWSDATKWDSGVPNNTATTYGAIINGGTVTQDFVAGAFVDAFALGGGTIAGSNPLDILDTMTWTGGTVSNTGGVTIPVSSALTIDGSSNKYLDDNAVLNIEGTAVLSGTGSIDSDDLEESPATINISSSGVFDIQSDTGFGHETVLGATRGEIHNSGTFKKSAGTGTSNIDFGWNFNNTGAVEVQSGRLIIRKLGTNIGSFSVSPGASLYFLGTMSDFTNASFSNAGAVLFYGGSGGGGSSTFNGPVTIAGDIRITPIGGGPNHSLFFNDVADLSGTTILGSRGTIAGTGQVTIQDLAWGTGGNLSGGITVSIPSDGQLAFVPGSESFDMFGTGTTLNVAGSAVMTGSTNVWARAGSDVSFNILAGGILDVQGSGGFTASGQGTLNNAGTFRKSVDIGTTSFTSRWTFNNTGLTEVHSGVLSVYGFVNDGQVDLSAGDIVIHGVASGSGSYTGSGTATFMDDFFPGNSTAAISFGGDVDLTSSTDLFIEFSGTTPGSEHDQLNVAGTLGLAGELILQPLDVFAPTGTSADLTILTAGTLSGAFSTLPSIGEHLGFGVFFDGISYDTENGLVEVSLTQNLAGDYDSSGTVDEDDFTLWRSTFGSTTDFRADGNGNRIIDAADYAFWRDRLGNTFPGAGSGIQGDHSVPEPCTFTGAIVALILLLPCRRLPSHHR